MQRPYIILFGCVFITMSLQLVAQKRDTTSNGEELLLASDLFKKSDEERRLMLLKPKFRYINKVDKPWLIKIGARPVFGQFPSEQRYEQLGMSLGVAFEKKFRNDPFSWSIETITRFGDFNVEGYDYKISAEVPGGGRVDGRYLNSGEFFTHRFRSHVTLRYYYNFNNRQEAEVSGNNLYSEYFFLRMRDVVAYTETNDLSFTRSRQLSRHVKGKRWMVQPAYISAGWGIQRPFFKKGLIDFSAEVGKRLHPFFDPIFVHKDFVLDLNIFIGLGL